MADDWGASVDEQEQGLTETVSTVKLQWLRHQAQCCPHVQYFLLLLSGDKNFTCPLVITSEI